MIHNQIITENQIDEWVRGNSQKAQGVIVELISRLVTASAPNPTERRFPLGDSVGQHGPDGILNTDIGFEPFVPEKRSYWEIGTGLDASKKATSDYDDLVTSIPKDVRQESTFIFVTPLSGRRGWKHTWKPDGQSSWLNERKARKDWRDARVIDGTKLIDWMFHFPGVERWMAKKMGFPGDGISTPELRWDELRGIGEPPPLCPDVFLANRDAACQKLKELFKGTTLQLQLDTHFPDQITDFIVAYIATMNPDENDEALGTCLIVSDGNAFSAISTLDTRHILVADFNLEAENKSGTLLLERARRKGHPVVYGGLPGGIPHNNRATLPNPKAHQLQEALEKAGYKKERARMLAQKSGGNLNSLLRCLQSLSIMPEWAQGTDAAELAIAELLGGWSEHSEEDKTMVEGIAGKQFGEWIGTMREIALRPSTPLIQHDGNWKVTSRYEAWYALGPQLSDEHLNHFKDVTVTVLRERDPMFDLSPDERYAASIHGKVLKNSNHLRKGLAEPLALLGSHPKALTS